MTQEVQPLTWQKRTNIEEHMQFFSKINEIIDNLAPTVAEAEAAIAQATQAIADANAAIATANAASAAADAAAQQAQAAAATVAGYNTRLTAVEGEADTNAANIEALQGRMGTAEGNITALQNVQPDYVKKAGAAQTVTSQIMVPTTATGVRDTQIANGTRIQNDLDNYAAMIRNTGAQRKKGLLTLDNGIVAIPAGWHGTGKTGQNIGEYCIFAKVTGSWQGRYEVVDFIQSSNTATAYGRVAFRSYQGAPFPVWAMRKSRGSNDPLSATSIVILSDGTDLYMAWKKEFVYGGVVCRLAADITYGNIPTESNITWFDPNDRIIVTDLSAYTVYDVVE
jgi:hypothetical protein